MTLARGAEKKLTRVDFYNLAGMLQGFVLKTAHTGRQLMADNADGSETGQVQVGQRKPERIRTRLAGEGADIMGFRTVIRATECGNAGINLAVISLHWIGYLRPDGIRYRYFFKFRISPKYSSQPPKGHMQWYGRHDPVIWLYLVCPKEGYGIHGRGPAPECPSCQCSGVDNLKLWYLYPYLTQNISVILQHQHRDIGIQFSP